jgi:hypothetical protein
MYLSTRSSPTAQRTSLYERFPHFVCVSCCWALLAYMTGETGCWRKPVPVQPCTCTGAGSNPGHYSVRTECRIDTQPCYCENWLMLYGEIIAVCSQIHIKHINTLCGQSVELLSVKLAVHIVTTGGTYSDHWRYI